MSLPISFLTTTTAVTAIVASSIVAVTVRAKAIVIERDEAKILAGLEELNGRLAELTHNAHPGDERKILSALQELNGRLAQLAYTMHPGSAGSAPWPLAPLVRPPRNWEDEV
jgi:hypothetical protein